MLSSKEWDWFVCVFVSFFARSKSVGCLAPNSIRLQRYSNFFAFFAGHICSTLDLSYSVAVVVELVAVHADDYFNKSAKNKIWWNGRPICSFVSLEFEVRACRAVRAATPCDISICRSTDDIAVRVVSFVSHVELQRSNNRSTCALSRGSAVANQRLSQK